MNPNTDYIAIHLQWIKKHPSYTNDCWRPSGKTGDPTNYYDLMMCHYTALLDHNTRSLVNKTAYTDLCRDMARFETYEKTIKDIQKTICQGNTGSSRKFFFVTIGFEHDLFTIPKALFCIKQILGYEWVTSAKANFEFHRVVEGQIFEHPHVHFFIGTDDKKMCKSKIIDKIFRAKSCSSIISNKNFIDVKVAEQHHMDYILLKKKDEKMPMVQLDIEWRQENNIPDFEKNWEDIQFV